MKGYIVYREYVDQDIEEIISVWSNKEKAEKFVTLANEQHNQFRLLELDVIE